MRKAARAVVIHNQNILLMKRNKFGTQYYLLPGGGIEVGETADAAVLRELREEASLRLANPRLIYIEDAGDPYGIQYIFLCDYQDGDVKLDPRSAEAELNKGGQNLFEPLWVPVSKLAGLPFRSETLKQELLRTFRDGYPSSPKQFQSQGEISYNKSEQQEE